VRRSIDSGCHINSTNVSGNFEVIFLSLHVYDIWHIGLRGVDWIGSMVIRIQNLLIYTQKLTVIQPMHSVITLGDFNFWISLSLSEKTEC